MLVNGLVDEGCAVISACIEMEVSRSTWYHRQKPRSVGVLGIRPSPPNKQSKEERKAILDTLHSEPYIDMTPWEIVPILADQEIYLGSIRTFYRVLAESNEIQERRLQARRIKHNAPILEANAPCEVWTWDITRLKGPDKGKFYYLYVMIDIFSRYVVGWMIAERENAIRAQNFIRQTVHQHIHPGATVTIHNDRGSPMKAAGTRNLMELLGLEHSFSRPRTSDDNPFSEAQFRTAKYHSRYPDFFESSTNSIEYFDKWFYWYNNEHMHTGLNLHTPFSVHYGKVEEVVCNRQKIMDQAYEKYPHRFSKGRPMVKSNPKTVGINLHLKSENLKEIRVENEVVA